MYPSGKFIPRWIAVQTFGLATLGTIAWAGCISDCKDDYDSEVESCRQLYDQPDDAEDLQQCIQSAKDEYQSCIDECTS